MRDAESLQCVCKVIEGTEDQLDSMRRMHLGCEIPDCAVCKMNKKRKSKSRVRAEVKSENFVPKFGRKVSLDTLGPVNPSLTNKIY